MRPMPWSQIDWLHEGPTVLPKVRLMIGSYF